MRQMQSLGPILAEHPFSKGLEPDHLKFLAGFASKVQFNAGEFILRTGEEASQFYLLCHGMVAVQVPVPDKRPVTIQTLREGDVLGYSWLFPPYRYRFDARAVELTRAIVLDGHSLRSKCEEDNCLGYQLMKRFAQIGAERLTATRLQLIDMYGSGG